MAALVPILAMQITLILDEQSVASSTGVTFHLNQAVKHPENPVLLPGEPHEWDSLQVIWPGTVLYDATEKKFRGWYQGLNAFQNARPERQPNVPWEVGYAESADGIHWTKPDLGQSLYRGRPTNRITNDFNGWTFNTVFPNPDRSDPQQRFLSIWKTPETFHDPHMTWALASSPDGKAWKLEDKAFCREPDSRHQMQDFWQILYDADAPPEFRYRSYMQWWSPRPADHLTVRQIGLQHGPDVRHLRNADSPLILAAQQGIDDQIHMASVAKVGSTFLMLFESDRFDANPVHGDLRLAVSHDGRTFRRVHPQTPVVPTGPKGSWDENLLVTTSYALQEVGDEVWIYYFGCPGIFRRWPGGVDGLKGSLVYPTYLGLATLPRDRFGYAEGPGTITLPPQEVGADGLWLNADGDGIIVNGQWPLGNERQQTVYRKVNCPAGRYPLQITLPPGTRIYSLKSAGPK